VELVAGTARRRAVRLDKIRVRPPEGWRREPTGRWFSQPYPWREAVSWLAKNLCGPARDYGDLTTPIHPEVCGDVITPRLTVAFVGDILPFGGRQFSVGEDVKEFFAGTTLLVGNFEGTLIDGRRPRLFLGQAHTPATLDFLADLFPPERTLLTCANNHAGEYGWARFTRSQEMLEDRGFRVIGRADEPAVLVNEQVLIAAGTVWLNRPCGYVSRLDTLAHCSGVDAAFRIVCPHWGYELEAYPRPAQIAEARRLLGQWDAIVGHHSHWPQPVALDDSTASRRLVAYSLGNFTFGLDLAKHLQGAMLRVELGPRPDGRWAVGRIHWRHTRIRLVGRCDAVVETITDPVSSEQPDRAGNHGPFGVRKDPRNDLGGGLPVQTWRDGGMVNADCQQSSERPEQPRGNGVLQRRCPPRNLVPRNVSRRLIEQPYLERFSQ